MSAPPPIGSIRLAALIDTRGGIQLGVSAALKFPYHFAVTSNWVMIPGKPSYSPTYHSRPWSWTARHSRHPSVQHQLSGFLPPCVRSGNGSTTGR
jgi:hypothetical protein